MEERKNNFKNKRHNIKNLIQKQSIDRIEPRGSQPLDSTIPKPDLPFSYLLTPTYTLVLVHYPTLFHSTVDQREMYLERNDIMKMYLVVISNTTF